MKKRLVLALESAPTKAKKLTLPASWNDRRCDALRRLAAEKLGCTGAVELRVGARALGDDEPIGAIPDGALVVARDVAEAPLALFCVRRDGRAWPGRGRAIQQSPAFYGMAADADAYLEAALPGAVFLVGATALEAHAAAWRRVADLGETQVAVVVERGAFFASPRWREGVAALVAEARQRGENFRALSLVFALGDGALGPAPEPCGGSPGYVLTPLGARAALAHCDARTPHEALFSGSGGVYASRRAILDFGDVEREGPGAPPPPISSSSQRALALALLEAGHFATPEGTDARLAVAAAMAVDRKHFLERAPFYEDRPCYLGWTTVSAPSSHCRAAAALLPALEDVPGARVLDVGAGSGYVAALLGALAAAGGGRPTCVALEVSEELAARAAANARRALDAAGLPGGGCAFVAVAGDGREGHAALAPYAAIHVGASCDEIPGALVDQLAVGGRLVMAVGAPDAPQRLVLVAKSETGLAETTLAAGFVMSPLR